MILRLFLGGVVQKPLLGAVCDLLIARALQETHHEAWGG
jgi:hypothetical protein